MLMDPNLSECLWEPEHSFEHFAMQMLSKLVPAEEYMTGRRSGLRVFCRLDVSVYKDSRDKSMKFLLDNIARSQTTGLFLEWAKTSRRGVFFRELSSGLHCMVLKATITSRSYDSREGH